MMDWIKEHVDSLKEIVENFTSGMSSGDKLKLFGILGIIYICTHGGPGDGNGGNNDSI